MLVNVPYMEHMGMDKSTISMAIFNSYFDITRGTKNACEIPSIQGKKRRQPSFIATYMGHEGRQLNESLASYSASNSSSRHAKSLRQ
jgi:hypothetical protein